MASEDNAKLPPHIDLSLREMLKGAAVGAAAAGFVSAEATPAEAQGGATMPVNPYGGGPSTQRFDDLDKVICPTI